MFVLDLFYRVFVFGVYLPIYSCLIAGYFKPGIYYVVLHVLFLKPISFFSFFAIDLTVEPANCGTGDIRLVGGSLESEGRLEVCVNQLWGTVCSRYWDYEETRIACRQLGHQELGNKLHHLLNFLNLVNVIIIAIQTYSTLWLFYNRWSTLW